MDEHKEPIRVYECPYCHKQFKRRSECESHINDCANGFKRVVVDHFRAIIKWNEEANKYEFAHYTVKLSGWVNADSDAFIESVRTSATADIKLNTILVTHYFTGELQVSFHRLEGDKTYTTERIEALLEGELKAELKKMLGDLK